jgi:hypothetical protein
MTSAVNGLPETLVQRFDFPWRKGAQARRTEKIVVGLYLTQFRQQNPYRRVRPIGDEKYPLADDFETLSIRTFLVVLMEVLSFLIGSMLMLLVSF